MELLERSADLEVLERALLDAESSAGSVVLVTGEAGIGKTRLVQAFCDLHADDARILWGACDDLSTPRTLGPFRDIASRVGDPLSEAVAHGTRFEVFDAVLAAVDEGIRPTVAVIEDVHWADGASLDVIKFLGRRIDRTGATLVLTYRDEEVPADHPLTLLIGDLPASAVHRVRPAPLSLAAVEEIAVGYDGSVDRLFARTRGNPFLVTEALMAPSGEVSASVRDAVRTRASRLSDSGRAVAEFVAVIPGQTERWLLETLPEFSLDGLDECHRRGLIEFDAAAAWYRHELVRGAMEGSLSPKRSRALNAAVTDALVSGDADIARIVHHALRADDRSTIARFAPSAGRRASAAAGHREALAHFRVAVTCADELVGDERAQLLTDYATECYLSNEAVEGAAAAIRALQCWREIGATIQEGDVLRLLSRLHWWLGHSEQAVEAGLGAVKLLSTIPSSKELGMAYSNLAQVFMLAQQSETAEDWATKAIEIARGFEDWNTLAHALNNLGSTRLRVGNLEGFDLLEESLDISIREHFEDHAGRAYSNLAWTALDYRRYDVARSYIDEGLAYAGSRELAGNIYYLTAERARLQFELGEWAAAEENARWVLGRPEEPGITTMPAVGTLARLCVRRGDVDVDATIDAAWQLVEPAGELQRIAPVATARAELAWLRGDVEGILAAISDAYPLAMAANQPWISDEFRFWMWRASGATEPFEELSNPFALQMAGRWSEAAAAWAELGCVYEQAIALMDSGRAQDLLEALEILDRLGAVPAASLLRSRLRRMGVEGVPRGPRRKTRQHPAGLTPRQVEVLDLVAAGLTNADIAERLFVSPKTVDHHVSALLTKLGASSRTEAARVARERGLLDHEP